MSSYTNVFGGSTVQPSSVSYLSLALTQNTTLSWPIQFQNTNLVVSRILDVVPTANGFTLTLPPATFVSLGQDILVNNSTGFSFSLSTNLGGQVFNIPAGTAYYFYLINNATADGVWRQIVFAGGASVVTSVTAVVNAAALGNLTITGSPITTVGTLTFNFANDLFALIGFGANTGIACRTAANTWALRSVVGTNNQIAITNPKGIAGDITVSITPTVTGINNLTAGNINIVASTISNTLGQNINFSNNVQLAANISTVYVATNGVNTISFAAGNMTINTTYLWPTAQAVLGQVLGYSGANQLAWATVPTFSGVSVVNTLPKYINTTGSLGDTAIVVDNANNMTGVTSITVNTNLSIGTVDANSISSNNFNGNIIFRPNGSGISEFTTGIRCDAGSPITFYATGGGPNFISYNAQGMAADSQYLLPPISPFFNTASVMPAQFEYPKPLGAGVSSLAWQNVPANPSILLNSNFIVWQRGTSFTNATYFVNNNNTVTADAWKMLSNGNNIVSVAQNPTFRTAPVYQLSSPTALQMTVVTANTKFGICQILGSTISQQLVGEYLTFSGYVTKGGAGVLNNFRATIIAWSGAADNPTSDPISAWNASGTSPTLVANWAYLNPGVTNTAFQVAGTGSPFVVTTQTPVPNGTTNLGVFVWLDDTTASVGGTMQFESFKLEIGQIPTQVSPVPFSQELERCKIFFQKDLPYSIAVGTTATTSSKGYVIVSPINAGTTVPNNTNYYTFEFEVEMRRTPTVTVYPWTTTTNTGRVSSNNGTDLAANSGLTANVDTVGFELRNTSGNIVTTGNFLAHYYATSDY